jgi:hypothetical protein
MADFVPYAGDVLAAVVSSEAAARRNMWSGLLQLGAQVGWDQARPKLKEMLAGPLGTGHGLPNGITLYEIRTELAERITLTRAVGASSVAGGIPMQLRVGPNLFVAKSTTPTAFGEWADPEFSVDFGVAIDFTIKVEPARMALSVVIDTARITGPDLSGTPKLDSQNFPADVALFLAEVISPFFGGPNFVALVEQQIAAQNFASLLNATLQPVNDLLGTLAKEGMGVVSALFADSPVPTGLTAQSLALGASDSGPAPMLLLAQPVPGNGVVRGEIRWPRSAGVPAIEPPYADAFALRATIDRGAGIQGFAQATDVTHVGGVEDASSETDHVLRYSLVGLPTEEALAITCAIREGVGWTGEAASMARPFAPEGWSGHVTVNPWHLGLIPGELGEVAFHEEKVGSGAQEVALNPQPIPPGRSGTFGNLGQTGSAASAIVRQTDEPAYELVAQAARVVIPSAVFRDRKDPSGLGTVEGIDFVLQAAAVR